MEIKDFRKLIDITVNDIFKEKDIKNIKILIKKISEDRVNFKAIWNYNEPSKLYMLFCIIDIICRQLALEVMDEYKIFLTNKDVKDCFVNQLDEIGNFYKLLGKWYKTKTIENFK